MVIGQITARPPRAEDGMQPSARLHNGTSYGLTPQVARLAAAASPESAGAEIRRTAAEVAGCDDTHHAHPNEALRSVQRTAMTLDCCCI